jgi:phosphoglycolate phosphatase-like HAD superfamily hydrolase
MGSFIIGDRATDIEAGQKAGCKAVLINAAPLEAKRCRPDFQAASLSEAAEWILSVQRQAHQASL